MSADEAHKKSKKAKKDKKREKKREKKEKKKAAKKAKNELLPAEEEYLRDPIAQIMADHKQGHE